MFAGGGAGLVHVLGPTGGYLLAFPGAAARDAVRSCAGADRRTRCSGCSPACALGMVVIHVGRRGAARRCSAAIPAAAFRVGFVPFFTGDLLKVGLAAGLILVLGPRLRGLR